jgi:hypothetical protein
MKTNTTYTVVEIKNGKVIKSSWGWTLEEARTIAKAQAGNGVTASIENSQGTIVEVAR